MKRYDLVFEGGGAKGIVFVGALEVLLDPQQGNTIRRLVGTSAGAITAALMAGGYDPAALQNAVSEKTAAGKPVFATFMDVPSGFSKEEIKASLTMALFEKIDIPYIPKPLEAKFDKEIIEQLMKKKAYRTLFSFVELGGLYAGDKFLEWMKGKLAKSKVTTSGQSREVDLSQATFAEFHQQTGRHLSVVASDTKGKEMRVLNHITAPQCPVAWGVRMSMSIPFVWQEVHWQPEWGTYMGDNITGNTIVDGGALSNFPLDLILPSERTDLVDAIMGPPPEGEAAVPLGLLIDEKLPVPGAQAESQAGEGSNNPKKGIAQLKPIKRVERLIDTMMQAHDRAIMQKYPDQICHLPAKGYGTTEFDMDDARREALIQAGREAMRQYLGLSGVA